MVGGEREQPVPDGWRQHATEAVVGVVGSVRHDSKTLLVRAVGPAPAVVPVVRNAIREIDPALALGRMGPLTGTISLSLASDRFRMILMGSFAGLALVLALVGLYGTIAYVVAGRARELAIRAALGARPSDLVNLIVRRGLLITAIGIGMGVALAQGAGRALESFLYDVAIADAVTQIGVVALVGLAALAASILPALRTLQFSPGTVLKQE